MTNIYEGWARFYQEPKSIYSRRPGALILSESLLTFKPYGKGTFYEIPFSLMKDINIAKYCIKIFTEDGNKYSLFPLKIIKGLLKDETTPDPKKIPYIFNLLAELRKGQHTEQLRLVEKLKQIMKVSSKISVKMLEGLFNLDTGKTYEIVYNWATKFGFTVDGDYLIVSEPAVSEFIEMLDNRPEADAKIEGGTTNCSYCGKSIDVNLKICPDCGNENVKF